MAVPSIYSIQRVLRHPADSFTSENTDVVKVVDQVVVPTMTMTSEITSDSESKVRLLDSILRSDLLDRDH